jgi:hypothetical protein
MRLLPALAGLTISFAVPVPAQEQNTVEPEVRQQIEALFKKLDDAYNENDLAAITARYTQDAVQVISWFTEYVCRPGGNREMV